MVKIVVGYKLSKNCKNPYGCCSTCHIGFRNCKTESKQCYETPDTCNLKILKDENKMICDNKSCDIINKCIHKMPHKHNKGCKIVCHNYPEAKCIKMQ